MRPWTGVPSRIRPGGRPVFRAGAPWDAGKNSSLGTVPKGSLCPYANSLSCGRSNACPSDQQRAQRRSGRSNVWLAVRPRTKPGSVVRFVSRQMPARVAGFFLTQDTAAPERKGHPKEHLNVSNCIVYYKIFFLFCVTLRNIEIFLKLIRRYNLKSICIVYK